MSMSGMKATEVFDVFQANREKLLDRAWLSEWLAPHCKRLTLGWRGDRLRMLQIPNEFADWLILLATRQVRSYIEIGTSTGGSFLTTDSYLRAAVPGYLRSVGYDRTEKMRDWEEYKSRFPTAEFVQKNSSDINLPAGDRFDAGFIDARHLEHWVIHDFERLRKNCKIVGFHDIVLQGSTVWKAWRSIKRDHANSWEFIDSKIPEKGACGIGAVEILSP